MNTDGNPRVWDGASPGHYEVWFLTFNHRPSQTGYWIRYTLESPQENHGQPYCQLWFARFCARDPARTFGINQIHPIEELACHAAPFSVEVTEDATLHADAAQGSIAGGGHTARWDIKWSPGQTHRQLPRAMYRRGGIGDTTYLSPNYGVPMSGTITVDGEELTLADEPGSQMHLWGRKHAHEWGWGHVCAFDGYRGANLEVLATRLKKAGRVLPRLTMVTLDLGDERLRLNQFVHLPMSRAAVGTGSLRFSARNLSTRISGEFTCQPDRMIVAPYVDPDGEASFCSNTEIGDLEVVVHKRAGLRWREHVRLISRGTAHFEVGSRQRDPAIGKDHVTI